MFAELDFASVFTTSGMDALILRHQLQHKFITDKRKT